MGWIQSYGMGQVQLSIRLPEEWVAWIDRVAEAIARPGSSPNRNEALRLVLSSGFEPIEKQYGVKRPKTRA
jgi:hypothetical protein